MFTCKSWTRKIVFVLLVVLRCGGGVNASPPLYRVVDLGTLGGAKSEAIAISDAGHIVGWSEIDSAVSGGDPIQRAFLWHEDEMHDLGSLGGPDAESVAYGVNGLGQVVGWTDTPDGKRAFLWLPEPAYGLPAGMNDLGTMGHDVSEATDINERSEIVGFTNRTVFLWLPNPAFGMESGMHELHPESRAGSVVNGFAGVPPHLNDLGQVAVTDSIWLPTPSYGRPAGWSVFYRTGIDESIWVYDLNGSGLVGVNSCCLPIFSFAFALWTSEFESGYRVLTGTGLNEQGTRVGSAYFVDGRYGSAITQRRANGSTITWLLRDYLLYSPGWALRWVADINNWSAIAADGIGPAREEHALFLIPINVNIDQLGTVDLDDFQYFASCLVGPESTLQQFCDRSDIEGDGDVDLSDFQALQVGFEGEE